MTQPEEAVSGPEPVAEESVESIIAGHLASEHTEEQEQPPEDDGQQPEAEADSEDDLELEAEELPPINAPVSWDAEAKERFANLPRADQEYLAKREGEREKFIQIKAQEAKQAQDSAHNEALQFAAKLREETVQHLLQYAQQFEVRPPDARLFQQDPAAYAQQLEAYQYATAQREKAQREAEHFNAEREQYEAALREHGVQQFRQRLEAELPEAFTDANGQKVVNQEFINGLAATAEALGYDDQTIKNASVEELKALKTVGEWKADADKYRKAMAKKMERVRAGKSPPPIAKPGVPLAGTPALREKAGAEARLKGGSDADLNAYIQTLI